MVGRRRIPRGDEPQLPSDRSPGEADLNEVVAYNFRAARELRGLTQEETAQLLERSLGQRLPQASISAIERAYEGDRRREFAAVLDSWPGVAHKLLQQMARRLREADEKAVSH